MLRPELTVAAIVARDGQFLMVEETVDGRAVFNQPAGHVEPGESFVDAVIRETREETAWGLTPEAVVGVYLWSGSADRAPILRVVFCGACDDYAADQSLDDGIIASHWLSRDELSAQPEKLRSPLVLRAIDDYLAGQRHSLGVLHMTHLDT